MYYSWYNVDHSVAQFRLNTFATHENSFVKAYLLESDVTLQAVFVAFVLFRRQSRQVLAKICVTNNDVTYSFAVCVAMVTSAAPLF